ncbi:DUF5116 domain-containing protein [Zobellia sp. OII3]|uniref:SusF/SusE family outer membrane protein n=1 Tax=Zobellia sp. OII3 TaxID=2034520 RepID=UPI000B534BBF|nr:SusF/SusE family outer membrane protein [Zobellia sp. OII3]OWW24562.1 DUF5116 domain-containing protein [Zobellia sp. OII3]
MKKIAFVITSLIISLGFYACSNDDDFTFVAQSNTEEISFENTLLESYQLSSANADNLAERFIWNKADFDVPTPVYYEVQASSDESFEAITVLASDLTENNYGVTVANMLSLAEDAGLDNDPDTEAPNTGTLYFRVRAYVGDDAANVVEQLSETLLFPVVLVQEEEGESPIEIKPHLFMVGDVTEAGWDNNANNTPLFRDSENDNNFFFTGRFAGSASTEGFKLLEVLGAWQPQWGVDGTNVSSSDILGSDPSAFKVDEDGYYNFNINTEELTYTLEKYDASAAATYTNIGIIGDASAGGWDTDTDLVQSTFDPHLWHAEGVELVDGEIKFRADHLWDNSWGASTELSGQGMNNNDPNIPVKAGTYNVWFNDLDGRYILIPQE